jgi:hypothetical protein
LAILHHPIIDGKPALPWLASQLFFLAYMGAEWTLKKNPSAGGFSLADHAIAPSHLIET